MATTPPRINRPRPPPLFPTFHPSPFSLAPGLRFPFPPPAITPLKPPSRPCPCSKHDALSYKHSLRQINSHKRTGPPLNKLVVDADYEDRRKCCEWCGYWLRGYMFRCKRKECRAVICGGCWKEGRRRRPGREIEAEPLARQLEGLKIGEQKEGEEEEEVEEVWYEAGEEREEDMEEGEEVESELMVLSHGEMDGVRSGVSRTAWLNGIGVGFERSSWVELDSAGTSPDR